MSIFTMVIIGFGILSTLSSAFVVSACMLSSQISNSTESTKQPQTIQKVQNSQQPLSSIPQFIVVDPS